MATRRTTDKQSDDHSVILDEWLKDLADLTSEVQRWAAELDWSTRVITKKMKDSRLGVYDAPALVMQKETIRVLLDPVARFTPGADGVVDLYLMPAYDDIASLYRVNGEWRLHHMFAGTLSVSTLNQAEAIPLSKETLAQVLNEMSVNAAAL